MCSLLDPSTSLYGHTITNKQQTTKLISPEPNCSLRIVHTHKCSFNLVLTSFGVQIFISFIYLECLPHKVHDLCHFHIHTVVEIVKRYLELAQRAQTFPRHFWYHLDWNSIENTVVGSRSV